jgi:UDP-2,3-diacylglucosamine hydrolase
MGGSASAPVAIIAGSGALPLEVANSAARMGRPVFMALISGSADPAHYAGFAHAEFGLGQLGGLLRALKERGIVEASLIGGVIRPGLTDIKPDFGLVRHWAELAQAFRKGDDGLLSGIIAILEEQDIKVVSALTIAPDLAVTVAGPVTSRYPTREASEEIALGLKLMAALSPFDVGQCVVVSDGRPVAIEGAEGTDAMLQRVAEMRLTGRLRRESGGGVLVKAPKIGQNMRIDIPAIGPQTVRNAADAGLQGIAIARGQVLLAERAATIALANRLGLFIEATP